MSRAGASPVTLIRPGTPEGVLRDALSASRAALADGRDRARGAEADLIEELERTEPRGESAADLSEWLESTAGAAAARRADAADLAGMLARRLAGDRDEPVEPPARLAWAGLALATHRLYGSGVHSLGGLPFLSRALLHAMVAEARIQIPERPEGGRRLYGPAGPVLARLAVSRQLRESVQEALGERVRSTYAAGYMYDPPGSHVRVHVDSRRYELVVHVPLEHAPPPDGGSPSRLVVHLPGERAPRRLTVAVGDAVLLHARGTIHSWEPLEPGESRTLIGIGFERA